MCGCHMLVSCGRRAGIAWVSFGCCVGAIEVLCGSCVGVIWVPLRPPTLSGLGVLR